MGYLSRMMVFLNLQDDGETAHEVKELNLHGPVRLKQLWCKGRGLNAYSAPYRVRLYQMNPVNPEACWIAELSPAELADDSNTADYLNTSLDLVAPSGRLFVTYQLLSGTLLPLAHLTLHVTFEEL